MHIDIEQAASRGGCCKRLVRCTPLKNRQSGHQAQNATGKEDAGYGLTG